MEGVAKVQQEGARLRSAFGWKTRADVTVN